MSNGKELLVWQRITVPSASFSHSPRQLSWPLKTKEGTTILQNFGNGLPTNMALISYKNWLYGCENLRFCMVWYFFQWFITILHKLGNLTNDMHFSTEQYWNTDCCQYWTMFCRSKPKNKLKFPVIKLEFTFCTSKSFTVIFHARIETSCMCSTVTTYLCETPQIGTPIIINMSGCPIFTGVKAQTSILLYIQIFIQLWYNTSMIFKILSICGIP